MKWKIAKIGDYCEVTSSKRIFYSEYSETGVPFYRSKENKPLTDLDKKSFFVAAIPVVPTGEKTLTIDGIDYKFKKVSSKDKTVTESYTHHSPFKVRNSLAKESKRSGFKD